MKKLFICETPMQVIITLCIKNQYQNLKDKVDLIISDSFNGSEKIVERIKNLNIFDGVYHAQINSNDTVKKLKKLCFIFNTSKYLKNVMNNNNSRYDEMYFWNYDSFSASLRSYFYKKNHHLKTFLFEESYTIYFPYDGIAKNSLFFKLINFKNKILHNNLIRENVDGLFMLEPKLLLYEPKCLIYKINRDIFNNIEFTKVVGDIFKVNDAIKNYDRKFIIFEEATYSNSNEFDDEKIILDIVDKVGVENILIKLHPRTKEDRFSKFGVKTLGFDGIPWEAITMCGDFSNKVFITISSSSVVNCRITFGKKMKGILLFRIVKPNLKYLNKKYDEFWNKLESTYPDGGIYIPNNEQELNNILEKLNGGDNDAQN